MGKTLALLGGRPTVIGSLPITNNIGQEEKVAVIRVMESGVLSDFVGRAGDNFLGGKEVKHFEEQMAKKFGASFAVSFNSATTALEGAVAALQLPLGSEIIVPPYTMTASTMAIVVNNLVPVFADITREDFCLDPVAVEKCITPKTRALMVVNLFGGSPDYDKLLDIAKRHSLKIIEDNAQGAGGMYQGRNLGTIGNIGVFSFNVHKTIQAGEGGVLVTNNEAFAFNAQLKRNHGENIIDDLDKHDIPIVGSNYRLTELHAAIATEQLKKMDFLNQERIILADYLTEQLENIPGITPFKKRAGDTHVFYVYPIRYDAEAFGLDRDLFVKAMQAEGLPLTAGYTKPTYLLNFFQDDSTYVFWPYLKKEKYLAGICPVAENLFTSELLITTICRYPLKRKHMDLFIAGLRKVWAVRDQLVGKI